MSAAPKTLYDKIFDDHVVDRQPDGTCLLYIDRHLVHEVTSPQAFEGLRMTGRQVRAPQKTLAVVDHNVPTSDRTKGIEEEESRIQVETLAQNAKDFGIEYYSERDKRQGIVHVIGPEQGFTLPAPRSSAVTATPPRTVLLARWRMESAPPRSSTFWPPRRSSRRRQRTCSSR